MTKRSGDFTLDEIKAICLKNMDCDKCPLQYGEDEIVCPIHPGYIDEYDTNREIELPETKKTYRPFNDTDELITEFKRRFNVYCPDYTMSLVWILHKGYTDKRRYLVTGFSADKVYIKALYGDYLDMDFLFENYTFLDGSPCGMEAEL